MLFSRLETSLAVTPLQSEIKLNLAEQLLQTAKQEWTIFFHSGVWNHMGENVGISWDLALGLEVLCQFLQRGMVKHFRARKSNGCLEKSQECYWMSFFFSET